MTPLGHGGGVDARAEGFPRRGVDQDEHALIVGRGGRRGRRARRHRVAQRESGEWRDGDALFTTARSGYARATDGRTAQPEPCRERRKTGARGAKDAPLAKVKGNGPARLLPEAPGRG